MHKLLKIFGASASSLGAIAIVTAACAADPARGTSNTGRMGRVGVMPTSSSARMPTMPTLPGMSIGNISTSNPGNNAVKPNTKCADGGVADSEYTIENCMNDLLGCVNGGALPGGLNDLFNEDLRNAIMNGMGLCSIQVDRCVNDVRKNCTSVYASSADVWTDFNSRRIQPEYYNFVLRKTGLTPNQAENTCLLLDRNTFGTSFAAVSNSGSVTTEYGQVVGAYNTMGGDLQKQNPQGVAVNSDNDTVDGSRGHYARWDATTATCLVRVAAYNKDKQISNTWLFGALGNDEPAEVWQSAGDTFSCNKDLFGFSLMNKTRSAAVVGVGGGAVVGAGIGAWAGHGDREFNCSDDKQLKSFTNQLRKSSKMAILNKYLNDSISLVGGDITSSQCQDILDLYQRYFDIKEAVDACHRGNGYTVTDTIEVTVANGTTTSTSTDTRVTDGAGNPTCRFHSLNRALIRGGAAMCDAADGSDDCVDVATMRRQLSELEGVWKEFDLENGDDSNMLESTLTGAGIGAGAGGLATAITAFVERNNISCHVGDGLAKVSMGKSYKIDSLKDFYVKWNLKLPDTAAPIVAITDCDSWHNACAKLTDLNQCASARISYKNASGATTIVDAACVASGSQCVENKPVAKSNGICQ